MLESYAAITIVYSLSHCMCCPVLCFLMWKIVAAYGCKNCNRGSLCAVSEKLLAIAIVCAVLCTRSLLIESTVVTSARVGDRKSACRSLEKVPACIVCQALSRNLNPAHMHRM